MLSVSIYQPRPQLPLQLEGHLGEGITTLTGPSGSGKTSIMKVIAGLLTPARGTVSYLEKGKETYWLHTERGICLKPQLRHVGYMPQGNIIFPHLTVRQNIQYSGTKDGTTYEKLLDELGLRKYEHRAARHLSGGEQQRVALGRALYANPKVLLLDEPLSALDWTLREKIRADLQHIILTWSIPTLWITHDKDEAAAVGSARWELR